MTRPSRATIRVLVVMAMMTSAAMPGIATAVQTPPVEPGESADLTPGAYLVQLDNSEAISQLAGVSIEHIGFGIYRLTESRSGDPVARARELSQLLGATVEPSRVSVLMGNNPEPDALSQWSLENTGQFVGGVVDADIDGEEAWGAATGAGVVVAVVDSGADLDHPDLAANLWINPGEIPGNGIDDDGNGFIDDVNGWDFYGTPVGDDYFDDNDPEDTSGSGHGTAVAGIIAAPINGIGMAGVAPDARIMVLRACGFLTCPDPTVIESIYYATNNGADVINLSLGRSAGADTAMEIAIQGAIDAGVVVIAAAGNSGMDNDIDPIVPASLGIDGLVSVAMTDHTDGIDPSSNFGAGSVHLGAPGVSIWTLDLFGGYAFWDGTSFASPTTTGVAALVREHRVCYSPTTIATVLQNRGDPTPSLSGITISGKRLNAFEALAVTAKKNGVVMTPSPGAVSFRGGSAGTVWTFGDGESTTSATAQHVYAQGLYEADNGSDIYEIAVGLDFVDTCTNKFINEIIWLSASGTTLGCDVVPNFCPDDTVIRAHMASFLARALNLPPTSVNYFTDDDGLSHEDNINRLREAGITLGCDDTGTVFCPDENVTRAQMATFLARALGLTSTGFNWFTDDDGLSHEKNINALADAGITLGCGNDMFCPADGIERDEMAAFLFRGRSYLP